MENGYFALPGRLAHVQNGGPEESATALAAGRTRRHGRGWTPRMFLSYTGKEEKRGKGEMMIREKFEIQWLLVWFYGMCRTIII